MNVHNHGPSEGQGIDCGETRLADGSPIGWCQVHPILRKARAQAWAEGCYSPGYIFGHLHDCMGWEDCDCTTYINPYEDNSEITAFCGNTKNHERHTEQGVRLPEFTCEGFYSCDECYEAFYSMQHNHVCEES